MKIRVIFIEPLLGTLAGEEKLAEEYILAKIPEGALVGQMAEEASALAEMSPDEKLQKSSTVFWKENGKPFLWDYQIKGFFKDACGMLRRVPETLSSKFKAHKKKIDGLVFPAPRKIFLKCPELTWTERPLRAQTAQGERIALARSETAPASTSFKCTINLLDKKLEPIVCEWLNYGALRGLGQWRNSGMGRFEWKKL